MNNEFAISVPIGAYHPFLRDCLKSLSIQSPRPRVALLDASGDPRVKAAADDFRDLLAYRRHGPDGGQSDAILEGWRHVDGDILGWLNADDALYPDALARASARFAADPGLEVVSGHTVIVDDDGAVTGYHWAVEPPGPSLLSGDTISQPSCFFRRSLHDRVGGLDADLHYTMDWDLWVRFWNAGARFDFIDETLSRVLWTKDAKTGGFNGRRRAEIGRILDANAPSAARLKSRIGFGLHYLAEYVLPTEFAYALREAVSPSSKTINGLGRNGEIAAVASLPLVHFGDHAVRSLRIGFRGPDQGVARTFVDDAEARIDWDGKVMAVTPAAPIEPAATSILRLEASPGAIPRLRHVRFA
ncbi:MAG: glycosyltransferase [Alphaproteobacteria bacterium]|nr:glycosyltransferase [Alphaproteobacteria bacterium]